MEGGRIQRNKYSYFVSVLVSILAGFASLARGIPIDLKTYPSHSRLTIQIPEGVSTEWKTTSTGFEVFASNVGLMDLGLIPDREKNLRDERVERLTVSESDAGVRISGQWIFPGGERALADPKMETFEFKQKNPSAFVVDFWVHKGLTVKEKKVLDTKRHRAKVAEDTQRKAKERNQRRIASQRILKQNTDPARFCEDPLSDEQDVWLEFRPVHRQIDFGRWLPRTTPDADFPYLEPKTDDLESQYVRLALKLYREGNYGLAMRTIDFFEKEFSKSSRRSELNFLRGNALIKLNLMPQAESHFKSIIANERGSPVALHAGMYLARSALEKEEYLNASEMFLTLIKDFPKHRLNWVFHLGAAESYYQMRQTDRSAKEYRWVIENAPTDQSRSEAAFRVGDLYLERRQYALALAAYFNALKYFESEASRFPEVLLNRAEALYGLGQHSRAEAEFKKYLQTNGQDPDSWRARWRMAELVGRSGPRGQNEAYRNYLLDVVNSHPFQTVSKLARLLLMSCGDHAGFTSESMNLFVQKANLDDVDDPALFTDTVPSLILLARARALVSFDRDGEAVDLITSKMHGPKIKHGKKSIEQLLKLAFRQQILSDLKEKQGFAAISFYKKYWELLPKEKADLEPDFLIQLSLEASDLGLGGLSLNLLDQHDALHRLIYGHRDLADLKELRDSQSLDEKLALSEQNFASAKALWTAYGIEAESKIQTKLGLIASESPYSYQGKLLEALILESKGKVDEAIKTVSQAELLLPASDIEARSRTQFYLSKLYAKHGNRMAAVQIYRGLASALESSPESAKNKDRAPASLSPSMRGLPGAPTRVGVLKSEAELLEKENRWEDAVTRYQEAITADDKDPQLKFSYARALDRAGNWPKAEEILNELSSAEEKTFWSKLAQEVLDGKKLGVR